MRCDRFFLFLICILSVTIVSAQLNTGFEESEDLTVQLTRPTAPTNTTTTSQVFNQSEFWITNIGNLDDVNATQFENNDNTLSIIQSWLITFWNSIFNTKTTDDLTEGSINLYDNQTWEEGRANTLYLPHTNDTNATTECGDGYYLDGDGTCLNFNDTVKKLFTAEQVVYNATSITTTVGTLDSGNIDSITQLADDDTYNISEVSGAPGFLIYINFTDVLSFNTVALRGKYDGGGGHTLALEIYRVGVGWEEREEITDQMDWGVTTFPVFIGNNFIDGDGIVQLRINHDDNGIIAHGYDLDAVFIGQVPGLVTGGDLADLTGRDNACILLPDVFCKDGSKNMEGNGNWGNFGISNLSWISETSNLWNISSSGEAKFVNITLSDSIKDSSTDSRIYFDINGTLVSET